LWVEVVCPVARNQVPVVLEKVVGVVDLAAVVGEQVVVVLAQVVGVVDLRSVDLEGLVDLQVS
jgi:hypothetical protein